jgi:hypothetical protein
MNGILDLFHRLLLVFLDVRHGSSRKLLYQLHLFGQCQKRRGKMPSGFGCGRQVASQLSH